MRGFRGRGEVGQGAGHPLENHKAIVVLCNTGPDPLEDHTPSKPAIGLPEKR